MTDKIFFPQTIVPVKPKQEAQKPKTQETPKVPFNQILQEQLGQTKVKFSNHALQRLQSRNIQLTPNELSKINAAVEKAAQKGAKDSLILMNNLALVVSVKNKTVITAVDESNMKENVFTNIDSAVII